MNFRGNSIRLSLAVCFALVSTSIPTLITPLAVHAVSDDKGSAHKEFERYEREIPELMRKGEVPGLSIAVVRKGKIVWDNAFGVTNVETKTPVEADSVFEAASLSKPVFGYMVLKLVDQKKIDLDTPLSTYLPGSYDVGDDARLSKITARRVLSHTTGFPNWRPNGSKTLAIHFPPGDRFSYSGEGFVYLARAVEQVTGEPFERTAERLVFEPLGMDQSSYSWKPDYDEKMVTRHDMTGSPSGQNRESEGNPAASLRTTARDYARFVCAILEGKGLSKQSHEMMLTPQIHVDSSCVVCVDRPEGTRSTQISWGLGWGLIESAEGRSFWHWGDNGNSKAFVVANTGSRDGFVMFANSTYGLSIVEDLYRMVFDHDQPVIAWIQEERYDSPYRTFFRQIVSDGAAQTIRAYRSSREKTPSMQITESRMNTIGYVLMRMKRLDDAILVFQLNVSDFPDSFNTYDSLGEAYMNAGKRELAIENYKRSIELNPKNENGKEMLKRLEAH